MEADHILIQKVIDMNIIPILLSHLKNVNEPHLMLEATWCVANLSFGSESQINSMVKKGLLDSLKAIITNKYERIFEQGAWAIGNIAAETEDFR